VRRCHRHRYPTPSVWTDAVVATPVPPTDPSELLRRVIADVIGDQVSVEVQAPGASWQAHVRLLGPEGRICDLLTGGEWQEARFHTPRVRGFILSDGTEAEVEATLRKLARTSREYLQGRYLVRDARGLFGTKPTLVLRTEDGEWRIGQRTSRVPYPSDPPG